MGSFASLWFRIVCRVCILWFVRSFWSRFSLFVAKKLSQKLWYMVYADFYGMPLSFLRRKTARLLSRGSEDPAIFRKVDQTFLFPLCIFSSAELVFFLERACVPENNNDCSNFLILHGFLWPPSEKQWKNRARERVFHKVTQHYSSPTGPTYLLIVAIIQAKLGLRLRLRPRFLLWLRF